jgi:hypothetical protein
VHICVQNIHESYYVFIKLKLVSDHATIKLINHQKEKISIKKDELR